MVDSEDALQSEDRGLVQQHRSSTSLGLLFAIVLAGLLVGLSAIRLGHFFNYPPDIQAALSNPNAEIDFAEVKALDRKLLFQNTTLCAAVAGAILLGITALAAAILGPSTSKSSTALSLKSLLIGMVTGSILGAISGLLGALVWQVMFDYEILLDQPSDTTMQAGVANAVLWALLGMGAGWISGDNKAERWNTAFVGAAAGVVGSLVYTMLVIFFLPAAKVGLPLPQYLNDTPWLAARLLWGIVPATIIGLLICRKVQR